MFARGRLDQSSNLQSQFFSASQSLRHGKYPESDSISPYDSPESSESILSDERSIYNAIRVTTPNDSSPRFYASLSHENPVHEQDLAINMARFVPTNLQDDHTPTNVPARRGRRQRMVGKLGNHTKLLSDQYWQATHRSGPAFCRMTSIPGSSRSLHRKAVSLGADSSMRRPRWPGNLGPAVTTVQPRYPPPERTPTPPGLPSFGTSEAMCYSARFMIPDNGAALQCGSGSGQRASSYGDTLRRLFGWPSSTSHAGGISVNGIGRAEDGTVVQGRFPHRQSGHGMSIGRQLHEHPFHQRSLPIAHHEATDTSHDPYIEAEHTKGGLNLGPRPNRRVQPLSSQPRRHFPFPSNQVPTVVNRPSRPRATALLSLSRNLAGSDGPADSVESSVQRTRTAGDHLPSNPSRLHSVFTMAVRGGGADEGAHASTPVCPDVSLWVKAHTCLFCCPGSHEEPDDSLGATSSRETYVTAQSQISPAGSQNESSGQNTRLHGLQAWISSLYGVMFPTLVNPAAV
ncbi:uncharacterized protein N7479_002159 [Penicillium vulpinum]|uniref:Uncharacterized protein n=1 Tax=Penicillium vulpinum TaxID=29845 RepID=A0A1V6S6S3_9EURO|nr:uncharacterized protein N7479_002159 [Penicillium vulpinum]KAJ5972241.1 hypothetical protein N7479_002159 [Penicillium vulpinum]OQE09755.1 hypothetical protein PENVUL_c005G05515 [Penicillium vulpinum]